MKRFISVLLMLALVLVTGVAAQVEFAKINAIEVNDVVVFNEADAANQVVRAPLVVERGSEVKVEVFYTGLAGVETEDARLEVSLGGYEHGVPRAITDIFTVRAGGQDKKTLTFQVPEDLEGSRDYTLRVEFFDDESRISQTFNLKVEEARHLVDVYDVIFSPGTRIVKAGQPLFVSVVLENMGENTEEVIKVVAAIPALGLREETLVNELVTDANEDAPRNFFFDEENTQATKDIAFMIPQNAQPGDYQLNVRVEYNRGNTVEEKAYVVRVEGAPQAATPAVPTPTETLVVNVDALTKNVNVGENVVYTINVANLGQAARSFQIQTLGVENFGSVRVDPQILTVGKDQTAEAFVAVTPTQGSGAQRFTVKLIENGQTVKEVALTANVQAAQAPVNGASDSLRNILEIGFIVLLVILVILGLIIVIKRLSEENPEEPMEGQTYY